MTSTRYTILPTDPDRAQLAAIYTRNEDGTFTRQTDEEAYGFNSAAWAYKPGTFGLVSTLDDYMKFARMLLGGGKLGRARILKPETVKLMATDAMPKEVTDKSWLPRKGQVGFGIDFAVRIAPPKDAQRVFRRGRRVLLGRRGQHAVLGRPEERHRRGVVHADAAVRQGQAAQDLPRCRVSQRSASPSRTEVSTT